MNSRDLYAFLLGIIVLHIAVTTAAPVTTKVYKERHMRSWLHPCGYNKTQKRSNRDVKAKEGVLVQQINKTLHYYKDELKHKENTKFNFTCEKFRKKNSSNLQDFYIDLLILGFNIDINIHAVINNVDNRFDYTERLEKLNGMRNQTKVVMCEIYDIIQKRRKYKSLKRKALQEIKKIRNKKVEPKAMSISDITMTEHCLYKHFNKTLHKMKNFLLMPRDMRLKKQQQQQQKRHNRPKKGNTL